MEQVFNSSAANRQLLPGFPPSSTDTLQRGISNCTTTTFTMTATGKSGNGMSGYTYTINQSGEKTSKTPRSPQPSPAG
jgi:hypothetical protein